MEINLHTVELLAYLIWALFSQIDLYLEKIECFQ